jgi:hypothetical protein
MNIEEMMMEILKGKLGDFGKKVDHTIAQVEAKLGLQAQVSSASAPPTPTTAIVAKPVAATQVAPPRVLEDKVSSEANLIKGLRGWLVGITRGRDVFVEAQAAANNLFGNKDLAFPVLSSEDWNLLFAAMKVAWEKGRYVLSEKSDQAAVFMYFPQDLVWQWVFGVGEGIWQTPLIIQITRKIATQCQKGCGMPPNFCAEVASVTTAAWAVADQKGLTKDEYVLVQNLFDTVDTVRGPAWLLDQIGDVLAISVEKTPAVPEVAGNKKKKDAKKADNSTCTNGTPAPAVALGFVEKLAVAVDEKATAAAVVATTIEQ